MPEEKEGELGEEAEKPEEEEREVPEEAQKPEEEEKEEGVEAKPAKTDAEKRKRLKLEKQKVAEVKERFRDYVRDRLKHDRHLLARRRREKRLGGTRGRRGG